MKMEKRKTKKYIEIAAVKPNQTYARDYYYTLEKEIKKMNKEILTLIKSNYKKTNNTLNNEDSKKITVNDAGLVLSFTKSLNSIFNKYFTKFDKLSFMLSNNFVDNITKYTTNKLDNNIEVKTGVSVKTNKDTLSFLERKQLQINESVNLIKSIPQKYHDKINFAVNESLIQSRNLSYLTDQIEKIGGITRRRAKNIALDQLNKATNVINNARLEEYGITKARWQHSGASKEPRPDHVKATGTVYNIEAGCKISGKYIQPGQLPNCKCICIPVIEI
mgnify:FL=1